MYHITNLSNSIIRYAQILAVALSLRHSFATQSSSPSAIRFLVTTLLPPPKRAVLAYLGIPFAPGAGAPPSPDPKELVRRAEVDVSTYALICSVIVLFCSSRPLGPVPI